MYRKEIIARLASMKPCPFCGGRPELIPLLANECFIKCKKCKIEQGIIYHSKKSAITAWNRRKSDGDVQ